MVLDNCRSDDGKITGLTSDFGNLEFLSMININLLSVSNLPNLGQLKKVSYGLKSLTAVSKCGNALLDILSVQTSSTEILTPAFLGVKEQDGRKEFRPTL